MLQCFGLARVGRDTEVREAGDSAVANVSLAFNYGRKGDDGRKPTQWVEGALWGKRAEALAPYLLKGQAVAVTLEDVHIETFQNRDGGEGHKLVGKIIAIDLAGSPPQQGTAAPAQRQAPAPAPRPAARAPAPATRGGFEDFDDVPFITASPCFDMEPRLERRVRRGDCR